ncbi:MAG: helix-turn-helix domain-containing protein [archaeon]
MPPSFDKKSIENAYKILGKKWCVIILCDMANGKKRFTDFLESNPALSARVLALRFKEMQLKKLVRKKFNSKRASHDYVLTPLGVHATVVLTQLIVFSRIHSNQTN